MYFFTLYFFVFFERLFEVSHPNFLGESRVELNMVVEGKGWGRQNHPSLHASLYGIVVATAPKRLVHNLCVSTTLELLAQ